MSRRPHFYPGFCETGQRHSVHTQPASFRASVPLCPDTASPREGPEHRAGGKGGLTCMPVQTVPASGRCVLLGPGSGQAESSLLALRVQVPAADGGPGASVHLAAVTRALPTAPLFSPGLRFSQVLVSVTPGRATPPPPASTQGSKLPETRGQGGGWGKPFCGRVLTSPSSSLGRLTQPQGKAPRLGHG